MKLIKRIIVTFLTLTLLLVCVPYTTDVQAAPRLPKSYIMYMKPYSYGRVGESFITGSIIGLKKGQKIASAKSSNKNIAVVEPYLDGINGYFICTAKKPGTITASFKVGKKTYRTKIHVKKYVNPIKTLSITGIKDGGKTDLASLTNKSIVTKKIGLKKTIRNPKIQVAAKSGWKILSIHYNVFAYDASGMTKDGGVISYDEDPRSKTTERIFKKTKVMKKGQGGYHIDIALQNTKDNATLLLNYYIDKDPNDKDVGIYY